MIATSTPTREIHRARRAGTKLILGQNLESVRHIAEAVWRTGKLLDRCVMPIGRIVKSLRVWTCHNAEVRHLRTRGLLVGELTWSMGKRHDRARRAVRRVKKNQLTFVNIDINIVVNENVND